MKHQSKDPMFPPIFCCLMAIFIILFWILLTAPVQAMNENVSKKMSALENAIWHVESSGHPGGEEILGDNGRSRGPLQISKAAWKDSKIPGIWEDCNNLEYSLRVFRAYMDRYAIEGRIGREPTDEDKARIWNGGPNGFKKNATKAYWDKVRRHMMEGE